MNSVEPWPLKDFEVGWSAFLFHRDYRDYFSRRGGSLYATLRVSPRFSVTAEGRSERQGSVAVRDPFTLFRSGGEWRLNPGVTDGHYNVLTGAVRYDTRNDRSTPTAGLFLTGEWELGHGTELDPCTAPGTATVCLSRQAIGVWAGLADREAHVPARLLRPAQLHAPLAVGAAQPALRRRRLGRRATRCRCSGGSRSATPTRCPGTAIGR